MTRLVYIITKRTAYTVSIPFFIELIFLATSLFYTSTSISLIHSLWFTISVSILTLYLAYTCLDFYYLGNDTLLHIMPFSNEYLLAIKSGISIVALWLYSLLGLFEINITNNQSAFKNFAYFGIPKMVSLISFFLIFSLSLLLIKSIRSAKVGLISCLLLNLVFITAVLSSSMALYSDKIQHWMIGISSSTLSIPIYANILQVEIVSNSTKIIWYMTFFNGICGLIALLLFISLYKVKRINYLTLTLN